MAIFLTRFHEPEKEPSVVNTLVVDPPILYNVHSLRWTSDIECYSSIYCTVYTLSICSPTFDMVIRYLLMLLANVWMCGDVVVTARTVRL